MSDLHKVARPYAQAIFDIARSSDQLSGWSKALATAAQVIEEETARRFLARPDISPEKRASFVEDIVNEAGCAEVLSSGQGTNLLRLLAEYGRLEVLPEIAAQFEKLKAWAEKTVRVKLITATGVDKSVIESMSKALEKRLGRAVKLECEVKVGLIGGAIIQAEDMVIDGSVESRLKRLADTLVA